MDCIEFKTECQACGETLSAYFEYAKVPKLKVSVCEQCKERAYEQGVYDEMTKKKTKAKPIYEQECPRCGKQYISINTGHNCTCHIDGGLIDP